LELVKNGSRLESLDGLLYNVLFIFPADASRCSVSLQPPMGLLGNGGYELIIMLTASDVIFLENRGRIFVQY
jgi:hypothetical protein